MLLPLGAATISSAFILSGHEAAILRLSGDASRRMWIGSAKAGRSHRGRRSGGSGGKPKAEFRADAYNVINRPNFGMPGTVRGRGDIGRISSILPGSTGRQIQLSLRLEF